MLSQLFLASDENEHLRPREESPIDPLHHCLFSRLPIFGEQESPLFWPLHSFIGDEQSTSYLLPWESLVLVNGLFSSTFKQSIHTDRTCTMTISPSSNKSTASSTKSSRGSWLFSLTGRRLSGKSRELLESMQEDETRPKESSSSPRHHPKQPLVSKRTALHEVAELFSTTSSQSVDNDFDADDERHTVDEWIMSSAAPSSTCSAEGHTSHSLSSSSSSCLEAATPSSPKTVQFANVTVHYHSQIILVAKDIQENPDQAGLASFALGWERVRSDEYETIGQFEDASCPATMGGTNNKTRTQALRISRDYRRTVFEQVAQHATHQSTSTRGKQ